MFTLDVSVVVRSLDTADPNQPVCQALIDALEQRVVPIIVPRFLLTELAGALRRIAGDPIRARLIVSVWHALPHVQIVSLDDGLIDAAAELAGDYALRGSDAIYVAVAQCHTCTLVSLDREQRERSAPVVVTATPSEALARL
ncbi:MAG: type II toxin-antitoxin system VapC family toxin [Chloroflexaceae bacterium]